MIGFVVIDKKDSKSLLFFEYRILFPLFFVLGDEFAFKDSLGLKRIALFWQANVGLK